MVHDCDIFLSLIIVRYYYFLLERHSLQMVAKVIPNFVYISYHHWFVKFQVPSYLRYSIDEFSAKQVFKENDLKRSQEKK